MTIQPPSPAIVAAQQAQEKLEACLEAEANFRLEAGAGAGKTYSLVAALRKLVAERGTALMNAGQRVACITYTEVARNEIAQEIEQHPAILVNTIHGFGWSFIAPFQKQLRDLVAAQENRQEAIEAAGGIHNQTVEYNFGFFGIDDKRITLHHDDIPKYLAALLANPKFQKIFSSLHPVLFIDEYQDTDPLVMSALSDQFFATGTGPIIGLFGDHWQTIYRKDYQLAEFPNVEPIDKGSNFRSVPDIVDVLNKLRPELVQHVDDETAQGEARFFHCNAYTGERVDSRNGKAELPAELSVSFIDSLKAQLEAEGWDLAPAKTKILMLTHNAIAAERGYPNLANIYEHKEAFSKKEDATIGITHNVRIADALPLERRLFVAHRDMSIFRGLSAVMPTGGEIVIGGDEDGSIPIQEFERLLTKFPTTTELNRYARARVADVVGQYVDGMADARRHYEEYMNRHKAIGATGPLDTEELLEAELAKYQLIRDTLRGWLAAAEVRVERDWQQLLMKFLLLIFPKYVAIPENVQIADVYSTPGRLRRRFIDIALVDAAGNLDVIEIKRPRGSLLAGGDYRENAFPSRELSGTIMQAEKYLFHLSKWGLDGERALTDRYTAKLPQGMSIRVTNPKAIVILGRDPTGEVWDEQAVDLEVVRRNYANVMDIMSYDDLLRRLDNVIASLRSRIDEETDI